MPINHDWTVKFPERLALLRKERGLTQPQLAEKIGLPVAQIRRYEAGTHPVVIVVGINAI
ncbi:MAG: helix-turn-helix transcriptional regulator [Acidobacteriaceae bacterium]|nr:helix-turn-helix transcriptional regulator [Acidobacteriaceae bacterium]